MKRFIIFLIAVLMSQAAFAQGWESQNSPTTNTLNAVAFVDSSHGWAVGDSGTVIHTADGGGSWTVQPSGTTLGLIGLDFVDANNGWAVGDSGTIIHTTDGGGTWTTQNSDAAYFLNCVDFVDINNGWVVGDAQTILHTTNGGGIWTLESSGPLSPLFGVTFLDVNDGWAVGGFTIFENPFGYIKHTTDGGTTWTTETNDDPLNDVDFVDASNGWAVGGFQNFYGDWLDYIVHTTDGGITWTTQFIEGGWQEFARPIINSVAFVEADNGWAVGDGILHTTNGGATWAEQLDSPAPQSVAFVDVNNGWAVGDSGTILRYNPSLQAPDEHSDLRPSSFSLSTFPNPFNASTTIAYNLPRAGHISLRVFDLLGREVAVLKDGMMEAGTHRVMFDGSGLASGIYFARLEAGEFTQTQKLMLMK